MCHFLFKPKKRIPKTGEYWVLKKSNYPPVKIISVSKKNVRYFLNNTYPKEKLSIWAFTKIYEPVE